MPEPVRALSHIKVIDLTRARSGPTCVRQLSEMGAQVIKIEATDSEEDGTGARHHFDFQNIHPNKRSVTLNLKNPEGRGVLLRMVEDADVVVENFRPDVKNRPRKLPRCTGRRLVSSRFNSPEHASSFLLIGRR
jgi:crotonobetainyl-CoA:carnitine CoA-transferase CaiB-like acyl-CoA transferase